MINEEVKIVVGEEVKTKVKAKVKAKVKVKMKAMGKVPNLEYSSKLFVRGLSNVNKI